MKDGALQARREEQYAVLMCPTCHASAKEWSYERINEFLAAHKVCRAATIRRSDATR